MTKNQFLKLVGLKGLHRRDQKLFIDVVRKYKGKLSYLHFQLYIHLALLYGFNRIDEIFRFVDCAMTEPGFLIRLGRSSL